MGMKPLTAEEKYEVVLSWMHCDEPIDGGYPNPSRRVGDLVIVAPLDEGLKPQGIEVFRYADLIAWYDRAAAYAEAQVGFDVDLDDVGEFRYDVDDPADIGYDD